MTNSADDFKPISPNPYIVGNPVRGRTMFFGREAEFELVRKRFQGQTRGSLLVFCGERRSGKTSILFQIMDGRLGAEFIPVLIDMQSMAIDDEADFLRKIATEVLGAIGESAAVSLPVFAEGSSHAARFHRFIREVLDAYPERSLVLLFDEYELFENKIDGGVLSRDVLHILSSLMENERVFIVFTGSQDLEARRRDYWHILGKSLYKTISYLDRADALALIEQPLRGVVRYEDGVVEDIYRLTAGQPFFTQAVCQSIVDRLNDLRRYDVTPALVDEVTNGLIQNPPPQMIFLWDGLERDEKLTLSLLAETLENATAHTTAEELQRTKLRRDYPLDLDHARIATALESLFRKELLTRTESGREPAFAFRMDLWRRWIRRMHTVWQVMRELGVPIRKREVADRRLAMTLAAVSATVVIGTVVAVLASRSRTPALPVPPGSGAYMTNDSGRHWERVGSGDRPGAPAPPVPPGTLRVETTPAGAEIRIDGRVRGKSPLSVPGLTSGEAHAIEATLAGYAPKRVPATVPSGGETTVRLTLTAGRGELFVTSDPTGARVTIGGSARGVTPIHLTDLPLGRLTFSLRRDGYEPLDTTVEVGEAGALIASLHLEPPGTLVLQGDRPARMYVDGRLIVENVQNSRPIELRAGTHEVQVILISGETIDTSVAVRPSQRATFDYSRRTLRWTAP